MGNLTLGNCIKTFGYENKSPHNALSDAKALQLVCQTAAKRLGYRSYEDYLIKNPTKIFTIPNDYADGFWRNVHHLKTVRINYPLYGLALVQSWPWSGPAQVNFCRVGLSTDPILLESETDSQSDSESDSQSDSESESDSESHSESDSD